jgi:hypothetical protein
VIWLVLYFLLVDTRGPTLKELELIFVTNKMVLVKIPLTRKHDEVEEKDINASRVAPVK